MRRRKINHLVKIYNLLCYIHILQILFDTYFCLEADQDVKSDQKEEDTNKTVRPKTYDVIFVPVEANIRNIITINTLYKA